MLRKLITVVLPLVLPFVVYGIYLAVARRRARLLAEGRPLPGWHDAPWGWIVLASVLLTAVSLGYYRATSGVERREPFLPPLSEGPAVERPASRD